MVEQRLTFNRIAGDYDAYRPGYPAALFDDLIALAPGRRVLEVGCGTGKATEALAQRAADLTALDPGPDMLAQARKRIGPAGHVRFVEAIFETWAGDANPFDLICAAQAWHWVEPVAGYAKASSLLAPGGLLAIFGNVDLPPPEPLQGELKQAFREAFSESRGGAASAAYRPEGWIAQQFEASGLFGPLQHHVYHHAMEYDPERYAALVSTLSDVQMLAPDRRAHLIENLQAAVARNGGRFTQQMETHLHWAVKRSPGG